MANELTSANTAQAINKVVAVEALEALVAELVMGNLVNRNYESALAQSGDAVNVPISPPMSANNIAEAGTVTNQNPNLGNATIVLNSHIEATFEIPDVTRALAVPDLIQTYLDPSVKALAEKIESDILALGPQFNSNTAVGTYNTSLTEATIDLAETALFKSKVPHSTPWALVVGADAYADLRKLSRFTEYQILGPTAGPNASLQGSVAIQQGILGQLKGFLVSRSQKVYKTGSNTSNIAFARDAIGLVVRRLGTPLAGTGAIADYVDKGNFGLRVVMSYNRTTLAQTFTVDVLYGAGILRNLFAVEVRS